MDCPECERLREEESEASMFLDAADAALTTAIPKDRGEWGPVELEQWKTLEAEAATGYQRLREARQKRLDHRATHG